MQPDRDVGTFSVQVAKACGAEVTAVCSARNMEQARTLGADHVKEIEKPAPKDNEVPIRVHAISVNYGDLAARNFKAITPREFNMFFLFWLLAKRSKYLKTHLPARPT